MRKKLVIRPKQWSQVSFEQGLEILVPKRSGVYVVVVAWRHYGLPANIRYIYIGKSNNLRRRYREHASSGELDLELNRLGGSNEKAEFWWVTLANDELDTVERSLIRSLMPEANRVLYRGQFIQKTINASSLPRSHCC